MTVAQTAPTSEAEAPPPTTAADYRALADVLENEQTRNALIAELRRLASQVGAAEPTEAAPEDTSIARKIADTTREAAEGTIQELTVGVRRLVDFSFRDIPADGMANLGQIALNLGAIVVTVLVLFYILRLGARPLYHRAADWGLAERGVRRWLRRGTALVGCSIIDLLIVFIAWVAGYAVALFALGEEGRMASAQSLFLNAFLLIESIKVGIHFFFATRYNELRLMRVSGEDAAYWYSWLSRIASFVGYGMLVVVPIVNQNLAPALGTLLSAFILAVALTYGAIVVMQNRQAVHDRLTALSEHSQLGFARVLYGFLARSWHLIVIAYLVAFAVVSLFRPGDALPFIVNATLLSVLAVVIGALASFLITRAISFGVHLPRATTLKYPMLESRLNAFVPTILQIVRGVIIALVIASILDAWAIVSVSEWIASELGARVIGSLLTIGFVALVAALLWLAVASWIEHRLTPPSGGARRRAPTARERTLLTIFRNAFTIALVVMTVMVALSEVGIDIAPLLAGAGVVGLAIGFGAQRLVQDVITGVFIQLENAMNAGDVVTAGGVSGVVEKLTVRSVGIRDLSGTYHLIPFSSVDTVSNFMRGFAYHVGEYGVAYRENVDEVEAVLQAAFEELRGNPEFGPKIIGDMEVHGITQFADSSVVVRIRIKTVPGEQWGVGRAYNKLVKKHFDAVGIEIPFPHVTLYFGEDKAGNAPPANLRVMSDGEASSAAPAPIPEAPDITPAPKPRRRASRSGKKAPPLPPGDSEV